MATATLSKEMLEAHPQPSQLDRGLLARCIDECLACEQSCTACADADLAEEGVEEFRRCIRLCLDCADVCNATGRLLTRQTDYVAASARAQVSSCREFARSARGMRAPCPHHEHCRICGETCRRCEQICTDLLEAIG